MFFFDDSKQDPHLPYVNTAVLKENATRSLHTLKQCIQLFIAVE